MGAVLLGASGAKLAARRESVAGLANLGVRGPRLATAVFAAAVVVEAACGVGALLGSRVALLVAAAFLLATAAVLARAWRRGGRGLPCGCFGAHGRISTGAVARNVALGTAAAVAALAPDGTPSRETVELVLIGVLVVAVAGLAVAVLALARELGVLRVRLGVQSALELDGEGPELGARHDLFRWFGDAPVGGLAVAIFTSAGCPMCADLGPAIELLRRDAWLTIAELDEERDPAAWAAFDVPGSPYAVVLGPEGDVLAKGTFNGLAQLESVVATAARRAGHGAGVA